MRGRQQVQDVEIKSFAFAVNGSLVAEWIHFTLLGIISPTIKLKVYAFGGL